MRKSNTVIGGRKLKQFISQTKSKMYAQKNENCYKLLDNRLLSPTFIIIIITTLLPHRKIIKDSNRTYLHLAKNIAVLEAINLRFNHKIWIIKLM